MLTDIMTSSSYSQLVGRIWADKYKNISSTQIRKMYATEIRKKYGGKLVEEEKACEVLDHSIGVHNTNYVIYFS